MAAMRFAAAGLIATSVWALGVAGCPSGGVTPIDTPPSITAPAVTGTLSQGQPGTVTVSATAVDIDGTVVSVTADLSGIGGQPTQPLTLGTNNVWSFTGTVTPPSGGGQVVTFTATDDGGQTAEASTTITVTGSGGSSALPVITNLVVTGSLTVQQPGTIAVSASVVAVNATITQVLADLSPVGGFPSTPLVQQTGNVWSFSGLVTPLVSGTQIIAVEATDSFGNTSTASTTIVVNTSFVVTQAPVTWHGSTAERGAG